MSPVLMPRILLTSLLVLAAVLTPAPARADRGMSTTAEPPPSDKGGAIVGLKIGVLLPQAFSPLSTSYYVEAEAGYLLPFARRLIAVTASISFTSPGTSNTGTDPRLPGGVYSYDVTQQQLTFGLSVLAKIPLGRIVPYIGAGPRFFLLKTSSSGQAGPAGQTVLIPETTETSTEIGVGVPLGVDILLGPGRLFGEAQLLWAATGQRSTGAGSVGSIILGAGYRLVL